MRVRQYDTSALSDRNKKIQTLDRLHSILNFLFSNVAAEKSYILRGGKDKTTYQFSVRLNEVTSLADKEKLTFITYELLQEIFDDK